MQRLGYLDFLRGIAIIFVVMGHIIQYNFEGISANECFNFIYSFHMVFFFFISGCTASLSSVKNTWQHLGSFFKKKSVQLLLPFFIWGVVGLNLCGLEDYSIIERVGIILKQPSNNAPWFIFQLFFIQVYYFLLCAFTSKLENKKLILLIFVITVPILLGILYLKKVLIGSGYTWIDPIYFLLFILGHFIQSQNFNERYERYLRQIIVVLFSSFIITSHHFDFHMSEFATKNIIKLTSSISFSVVAYYLIKIKYDVIDNHIKKVISYFGRHTLEIYLTHFCIIKIFQDTWIDTNNMNAIPLFLMIFILSIPVSVIVICVSNLLKTIPFCSLILYGKKQNS